MVQDMDWAVRAAQNGKSDWFGGLKTGPVRWSGPCAS